MTLRVYTKWGGGRSTLLVTLPSSDTNAQNVEMNVCSRPLAAFVNESQRKAFRQRIRKKVRLNEKWHTQAFMGNNIKFRALVPSFWGSTNQFFPQNLFNIYLHERNMTLTPGTVSAPFGFVVVI